MRQRISQAISIAAASMLLAFAFTGSALAAHWANDGWFDRHYNYPPVPNGLTAINNTFGTRCTSDSNFNRFQWGAEGTIYNVNFQSITSTFTRSWAARRQALGISATGAARPTSSTTCAATSAILTGTVTSSGALARTTAGCRVAQRPFGARTPGELPSISTGTTSTSATAITTRSTPPSQQYSRTTAGTGFPAIECIFSTLPATR